MEPRLMVDRCTGGEIFFGDAPGEETGEAGGVSPNPPTSPQAHNAMKGPLLVQVDGRSGAGESYAGPGFWFPIMPRLSWRAAVATEVSMRRGEMTNV